MTIYIDSHEPFNIEAELNKLGIKTKRINLTSRGADYVISNIGIERKEVSDLLSSVYSKRLYNQLWKLKNNYDKPILFLVGEIPPTHKFIRFKRRVTPVELTYEEKLKKQTTIISNLITAYTSYGICWWHLESEQQFVQALAELYFKSKDKTPKLRPITKKKSHDIFQIRSDIYSMLPFIGRKGANTLAKKYSIADFSKLTKADLKNIKGMNIGDKKSKLIWDVFHKRI